MQIEITRDRALATGFLTKWENEFNPPLSKYPGGIEGTVNMFLDHGEMLLLKKEQEAIGFLGYTKGELANSFANRSIGYVYTILIHPDYRGSKAFLRLARGFLSELEKQQEVSEVRFKAIKKDRYTNKLYSKFAKPIREEPNSQGVDSVLYSAELERLRKQFAGDE